MKRYNVKTDLLARGVDARTAQIADESYHIGYRRGNLDAWRIARPVIIGLTTFLIILISQAWRVFP